MKNLTVTHHEFNSSATGNLSIRQFPHIGRLGIGISQTCKFSLALWWSDRWNCWSILNIQLVFFPIKWHENLVLTKVVLRIRTVHFHELFTSRRRPFSFGPFRLWRFSLKEDSPLDPFFTKMRFHRATYTMAFPSSGWLTWHLTTCPLYFFSGMSCKILVVWTTLLFASGLSKVFTSSGCKSKQIINSEFLEF